MHLHSKFFDTLAHLVLFFVLSAGAVGIYLRRYSQLEQFLIILALSASYIVWGVVYHLLKGDFGKKLFLEYLLLAAIAAVSGFLVYMN